MKKKEREKNNNQQKPIEPTVELAYFVKDDFIKFLAIPG